MARTTVKDNRHTQTQPANLSPKVTATAKVPRKRKHSPNRHPRRNHHEHSAVKKQRLWAESLTLTVNSNTIQTHSRVSSNEKLTYKHQKIKKRRRKTPFSSEDNRKWVYASQDFSGYKDKIVLLSYNILGVENASKHQDLYSNVPVEFLGWKHRKKLIWKEIDDYNPSILCFQEVDRFDDLEKLLKRGSFQGVYLPRTGEACDGCAIFWRSEIFSLLHQENIEFESFGLRNNVAQLCVLKMNQSQTDSGENIQIPAVALPSRSIVVGNIHVLFNPARGDVKLGQVRLLLEKAYKLSQESGGIPVVVAGDFNSVPQSAMYQFLATSELDTQLHDRRKISGQLCPQDYHVSQFQRTNEARFCMYIPRSLKHRWSDDELRLATGSKQITCVMHRLKLHSAYAGVHEGSLRTRDSLGEPLATSYHSKFMGTVDYIWHTKELVSVRVLETLPIDVLRKTRGLPTKKWGSDHLALVCELAFADVSNTT